MNRCFYLFILSFVVFAASEPPTSQIQEYNAEIPKTILELQQFREIKTGLIRSSNGREGTATLTNLNPTINAWYLLNIRWKDGTPAITYHLENPRPQTSYLLLDRNYPSGLIIVEHKDRFFCEVFEGNPEDNLEQARRSQRIFFPLCGKRIYLRNLAVGHRTALEGAVELLRDQVWGGEKIIALGHYLKGDTYRETGTLQPQSQSTVIDDGAGQIDAPISAWIDAKYANRLMTAGNLGIVLKKPNRSGMAPGAWYAVDGNNGVYISIIQPNFLSQEILQSYKTIVNNLDNIEASSLCYLVAFDLDQFELGYALGTEHPRVGWSDHMLAQMRDSKLPGPDGIGSISPIISTGLVNPENTLRTVAVFTGGYKRTHGAFKFGEFALKNHGTHYGFLENGVVFSKLQQGLSTIYVLDDRSIRMKTWDESDNKLLNKVRYARQNGVPLIESDEISQPPVPGRFVARWGPGNWSGSEDARLRTIRSGAAVQIRHGKRFLIYALFSDATPSAMARVFQAYRCQYAMLLDMNALEHTYMALYRRSGSQMYIDHLLKAMSQFEQSSAGELIPRFLGYPDNRDFFYLMRRNDKEIK